MPLFARGLITALLLSYTSLSLAAPPDRQSPTPPSNLIALAASPGQVNLAWTASTDNVGVSGYQIERCTGASCASFSQIGTATTTTFSDGTVIGSTSYLYRVRARDAANNLSTYSSIASASTPADIVAPSAPTALSATTSGGQVILGWTAANDNVGVTAYLIERCLGAGCTTFAQVGSSSNVNFSDTGLAPLATYRYQVRARDAANNLSRYSNIAAVTTSADSIAPSIPGGLTASVVSPIRIDLLWTASTDNVGVAGYFVERCAGSKCTNFVQVSAPTAANYSDASATPRTTYRYRVRAKDAANNLSGYSSIVNAATPRDTQAPSAPSSITASPVSSSQIALSWASSTDDAGVVAYLVERCSGVGCTNFSQVSTPATLVYNDNGLVASTMYRYRVRAQDAANNVSVYSSIASAITLAPDTEAPTIPASFTAVAVSANRIDLSWAPSSDNSGVSGYSIERCQGAGCSTFAQVGIVTQLSFSDTALAASTTYRYRVRAYDAIPNYSGYSTIVSVTTQPPPDTQPPSAPTGLSTLVISNNQINLSWVQSTDNVGVVEYLIERCSGAGCTGFAALGTVTVPGYFDIGLTVGSTYRYRVRARDAVPNFSAYSNIVSAVAAVSKVTCD